MVRVGIKMVMMEQMAEGLLGLIQQDMLGVREQHQLLLVGLFMEEMMEEMAQPQMVIILLVGEEVVMVMEGLPAALQREEVLGVVV